MMDKHAAEATSIDSSALIRALDAACDRFEVALQAAQQPRIEDYLRAVPEVGRPQLVRELVAMEMEYRRDRGEQRNLEEEYRRRFAQYEEEVEAACRMIEATQALVVRGHKLAVGKEISSARGLRRAFDAQWRAGHRPHVEDVLQVAPRENQGKLLIELLTVEIACRRQRGEQPEVDEYRQRFPQFLTEVDTVFLPAEPDSVVVSDHSTHRSAPRASASHTSNAAGSEAVDELRESSATTPTLAMPANGSPPETVEPPTPSRGDETAPALPGALRIRCPHCRNPIDLLEDKPLSDVVCPICGSSFGLVGDEALAYQTQGGTLRRRHQFGRFELIEQLGVGAFGTVWKAHDPELQRLVAIKIPRQGALSDQEAERFVREARASAQLRHPNIVGVHEVGREGNVIYIVSDFVKGLTLADYLSGRRFTQREATLLCIKIAAALDSAHQRGVIHRDLKPGNILLDEAAEPYLTDFGLARREADEVTMTREGEILGTPAYMSPEQARGGAHIADARSDVYSLGVILYQLLTGECPFRGSVRMVLRQVIEDAPQSPRRLDAHVSRDLEAICLRCLEKSPQHRFASAKELADELQRVALGEPVRTRPVGMLMRAWRWYCRTPAGPILAAGGYLTLWGAILIIWAILGLVVYPLRLHPTEHPFRAMADIAMVLVGLYLPMLWAGIRALNGHAESLWIGALTGGAGLVASLLGITGKVFDAGTFGPPEMRIPLFGLLAIVSLLSVVVSVTAIVTHHIRRDTI